jgi:nucleotide-binding universal stress UspA family protein
MYKHILVPVDGSATSQKAIGNALWPLRRPSRPK